MIQTIIFIDSEDENLDSDGYPGDYESDDAEDYENDRDDPDTILKESNQ